MFTAPNLKAVYKSSNKYILFLATLHSWESQEDHREDPEREAEPSTLPDAWCTGPHTQTAQGKN